MSFDTDVAEPDPDPVILWVGQDRQGHWLVQENHGRMEGRFVSREAAWRFARAERHGFPGAELAEARQPLVAAVSFEPVGPDVLASRRAA